MAGRRMMRRWASAVLCGALACGAAVRAAGDSSGDATFAALAQRYFYEGFALDPVDATTTGVHDYDDSLGSYGPAAYARRLARDRAYIARLTKVDPRSLSAEVAVDRTMLENSLRDDLLINGTLARWRHNPDLYVNLASNAVFGLISRNYAPLDVRLRHAILRELEVPRLFAQAKENLTRVDADSASIAYQDALGAGDFFANSVPRAFAGVADPGLQAQFTKANGIARRAALDFAAWLKAGPLRHPRGTYAIGPEAYRLRLQYEDGLDMPLDRYLSIGEQALAATRARFVATARKIDPTSTPETTARSLSQRHPSAAGLVLAAQHDLAALRTFVVEHRILTLPPDADIKVVETPEFERQTSFASMDAPGPLERVATQAYFNVTPVDPGWSAKRQDEYLGFLNDYVRPIVAAHEVYPGHYVNFAVDKHLQLSLTRRLLSSPSFVEGWAHYDEQMIVDEGWGGGDPRVRLAQLGAALLRECRYVVGVKEHTQGMTVAQATDFFMRNAFMAHEPAYHEALRGTQDATYGYYTLGKLEILKLRADMRTKMGAGFTLQRFHDALLAHGDPPIPLLRPLLLGASDDGNVL
jgi:hypothetical protein